MEQEIKQLEEFVGDMDHLLQEGVIPTVEEKQHLLNLTRQLQETIDSMQSYEQLSLFKQLFQ